MNPSSDVHSAPTGPPVEPSLGSSCPTPTNWREGLMALICSRITLIQLEFQEVGVALAKSAVSIVAAILAILFGWGLLLAGAVAAIAEASGIRWFWIALIAAAIHLVAALILASRAKPSRAPAFPVTRAEFQKDREWIENLHTTGKSRN